MNMIEVKQRKTVADYLALPDDLRVELFDGEYFVCPAPNARHQVIVLNLASKLLAFVRSRDLGKVFCAPFDVILSNEDIVQPDVLYIAKENLGRLGDRLQGPPDLAVEVISFPHAERDRIIKRDLYAKYGVREFWMIDPTPPSVEVLTLQEGRYRLQGIHAGKDTIASPLFPGLAIPVAELLE